MDVFVIVLLVLALLLTVGALVGGLVVMAVGGEVNARWSNKFMRYRVLFQGIAIALFLIALTLTGRG